MIPRSAYRREQNAYAHSGYAHALAEFGKPRRLEQSGGWLLERSIPKSNASDAMGCYPLFCCRDWSALSSDVKSLAESLVAVSLVADPFAPYGRDELNRVFDVVRPLKEHYVVDLNRPVGQVASKHHRYSARRALEAVSVSPCVDPPAHLDDWVRLYGVLVRTKGLRGLHTFSAESFRLQLGVPGAVLFVANVDGRTVGAHWFYVDGEIAYSHLAACDEQGYRVGAPYALQWSAIEYLGDIAAWLDLGGAPGVTDNLEDGLARFKRGWSTHIASAHLCGHVFDEERYAALSGNAEDADYFPMYRGGEFA